MRLEPRARSWHVLPRVAPVAAGSAAPPSLGDGLAAGEDAAGSDGVPGAVVVLPDDAPVGPGIGATDVPEWKTVGPVKGAAIDASVPARFATGPPGKV